MGFVLKSSIKRLGNFMTMYDQDRLNKIVSEAHSRVSDSYFTSVFLSHSHHDTDLIFPIVVLLRGYGIDVYVDWMDETMSKVPTGETAQKLKTKIQVNNKFLFLATNSALSSKWCNWEIGYGDAYKYIDDIAVFPILSDGKWEGQEYLQIYPSVKLRGVYNEYHLGPNNFYVEYPNGDSMSLKEWIKQ